MKWFLPLWAFLVLFALPLKGSQKCDIPGTFYLKRLSPLLQEQAQALMESYCSHIRYVSYEDSKIYFNFNKRKFSFGSNEGKYDPHDLASLFFVPYPLGVVSLPVEDPIQNPGGYRVHGFFEEVYGRDMHDVTRYQKRIEFWDGVFVWFHMQNGAGAALEKVISGILFNPSLKSYLQPIIEAYEDGALYGQPGTKIPFIQGISRVEKNRWRHIKGTNTVSAHSFGIALDILHPYIPKPHQYWQWMPFPGRNHPEDRFQDLRAKGKVEMATIPWELIELFEANGFIWGGKWYYFDTMHFEYRPELTWRPAH